MQVIGGSHHHAQLTFRDSTAAENNVLVQTVDNAADYGDAQAALEIRAGQVFLHSDWILHGSRPNSSNRHRCGLAMRYLSADVRAFNGWNANSIWCRGTDAVATGPTTPAPTATHPHPPKRRRGRPRQGSIPQPPPPAVTQAARSKPLSAQATCVPLCFSGLGAGGCRRHGRLTPIPIGDHHVPQLDADERRFQNAGETSRPNTLAIAKAREWQGLSRVLSADYAAICWRRLPVSAST